MCIPNPEGRPFNDRRSNVPSNETATKTCPACRKTLSVAAFNGSARTADGLARRCRACTNSVRRRQDRARRDPGQPTANLAAALRQGDADAVRNLVSAGATPHWSWVCEAMRGGHLVLAEILLESGVDSNLFTMAAVGDLPGVNGGSISRPATLSSQRAWTRTTRE